MKIKKSELQKIIANVFKKYFKDLDNRIFITHKEVELIKNIKSVDKVFNKILNKAKQISNDYLKDIEYHNYELDITDIKCLDILDIDYSDELFDDFYTELSSLRTYFNFDFDTLNKYPERDLLLNIDIENLLEYFEILKKQYVLPSNLKYQTLLNDIMNTMYNKVKILLSDRYEDVIYITDKYFDNEHITFEIEIAPNTIIIEDTLYIIEDTEDFEYIFNTINKYE